MKRSGLDFQRLGLAEILNRGSSVDSVRGSLSKASNFGLGDRPWREIVAYQFEFANDAPFILNDPRLHIHIPYCFGLLAWTLAARNDVETLGYYRRGALEFSDDGETMCGAFGARLYGLNHGADQLKAITSRLVADPSSRRTLASISTPADNLEESREYPCASGVQLFLRNGRLDFLAVMRAQQALTVLPYDVFLFSTLHHFIANELEARCGIYHHFSGTFHIYDDELPLAEDLAGSQPVPLELPELPPGRGAATAAELVELEASIRQAALAGDRALLTRLEAAPVSCQFSEVAKSALLTFAHTRVG